MSDIAAFQYYLAYGRALMANLPAEDDIPPLLTFQIATANIYLRMLGISPIILNTTPMGGGKTYYTCFIAWFLRLPLILIGLSTMRPKWCDVSKKFGVPLLAYYTFTDINGTKTKQPKCPLIRRVFVPNEKNDGTQDYFEPTELLDRLANQGVLICFDEASKLKNETATFLSAWTICQYIAQHSSSSRIIHLSASPADKHKHANQLLGLLGINRRPNLYIMDRTRRIGEQVVLTGFNSVRQWAQIQDPETEARVFRDYGPSLNRPVASNVNEYAFRIWTFIVGRKLTLAGPAPTLSASTWNVYCDLDRANRFRLQKALAIMKDALQQDEHGETKVNMAVVQEAMIGISQAKQPLVIDLARSWLQHVPNSKVVIADHFHFSVDAYAEGLHQYSPLKYTGHVDHADRERHRQWFVDPNHPCRVLCCTIQTGQMGVDMDAKMRGMNILLILLPTYHFLSMYQMSGRVTRADTKTMPTIITPYVYDNPNQPRAEALEQNLLLNIQEKTDTAKEYLCMDTGCLPFPGEYPPLLLQNTNALATLPGRKVIDLFHTPDKLELALQHGPSENIVSRLVVAPMMNHVLSDEDMTRLGLLVKYGYDNAIRQCAHNLPPTVQYLLNFSLESLCWSIVCRYDIDLSEFPRILRNQYLRDFGDRYRFSFHG